MSQANLFSAVVLVPVLITLISGTVSSLANKIVFDTYVEPTHANCERHQFSKPYFFTLCMFIGEMMCLGVYYIKEYRRRRAEQQSNDYARLSGAERLSPVLTGVNHNASFNISQGSPAPGLVASSAHGAVAPVAPNKPPKWVYALLCIFDLSATSVGGVGLIWVDASTNQMLRGSMVVFCAIFSVMLLKRRLSAGQWGSIALVCVGLAMVGLSGMLKTHYNPPAASDAGPSVTAAQQLIGIMLVLLASVLNAIQMVLEEKLLKAVGGAEVDPLELVGWEGVFGTILAAFALLPIVSAIPHTGANGDCGVVEDTLDTFKQLARSPLLSCLTVSYIFGLALMNWTSQQISQVLSSVHRNLVSAVRTVLVWVIMLIVYYSGQKGYGEEWTKWSLIELGGFIVLVGGTVLYSWAGMKLAKQQEDAEKIKGDFQFSPEYVLPIEPQLAEHSVIAKQQSFSHKTAHSYQNGVPATF